MKNLNSLNTFACPWLMNKAASHPCQRPDQMSTRRFDTNTGKTVLECQEGTRYRYFPEQTWLHTTSQEWVDDIAAHLPKTADGHDLYINEYA